MALTYMLVLFSFPSFVYAYSYGHHMESTEINHAAIPKGVTRLVLIDMKLTIISETEFQEYTLLEELDLNRNQITFVGTQAFSGTKLRSLNLASNNIGYFPNLDSVLNTLETLRIGDNTFTTITTSNLRNLKTLKNLYLDESILTSWPDFTGVGSNYYNADLIREKWASALTTLSLGYVTTLPRLLPASACSFENLILRSFGTDGEIPLFTNCLAANVVHRVKKLNLGLKGLTDTTDLTPLEALVNLYYLSLGSNMFTQFPNLPMSVRGRLIEIYIKGNSLMTTFPSERMDGLCYEYFELNGHSLTKLPSNILLPCPGQTEKHLDMSNNSPTLKMNVNEWTAMFCHNELRIIDKVTLLLYQGNLENILDFPDISHVLCQIKGLKLQLQQIPIPCDCSVVWLAKMQKTCNFLHYGVSYSTSSSAPCGSSTWDDNLNCPDSFAMIYAGANFDDFRSMVSAEQTVNGINALFSVIIRGHYAWELRSASENLELRPGEHRSLNFDLLSLAPLIRTSDIKAPAGAVPVPSSSYCGVAPLIHEDVLRDSDMFSGYEIANTRQEFTLTHPQPAGIGRLDVITQFLPCSNPFNLQVFVEADRPAKCNSHLNPVLCTTTSYEDLGSGYQKCTFECDCGNNVCRMDNTWLIYASSKSVGYLCEVVVL